MSEQIVYHIPRDELARTMWARMVRRRSYLFSICSFLCMGILFAAASQTLRSAGIVLILYALSRPMFLYRALARSSAQPSLVEEKRLTFDSAGLEVAGSDWSTRRTWRHFVGWDEDARYFYVDMTTSALASLIPKSAMSGAQQELLRGYLKAVPGKAH